MLDSVTMEIESNESIDACEVGAAKDRDSNNSNSGLVPTHRVIARILKLDALMPLNGS